MIRSLYAGETYPWPLLLDADPDRETVETYLAQSQVLVFAEQDCPVGMIVFQQQLDTWEIMNIAVAPTHQNRGIGRQLLQAAEAFILAHNRQQTAIDLLIKTGDISPARYLYQSEGFILHSRQKNYFIKHYPEPIYEEGQQLFDQIILVKQLIRS